MKIEMYLQDKRIFYEIPLPCIFKCENVRWYGKLYFNFIISCDSLDEFSFYQDAV